MRQVSAWTLGLQGIAVPRKVLCVSAMPLLGIGK
jgi:hypothetical protein